jgi:hypothetical protein
MQAARDLRSVLRENLRLRLAVAAGGLVVAAVIIVAADRASRPWAQLADGVGVALLTTALVGLIYEVWLRNTAAAEVLEMVGLSNHMLRGGIREVSKYTDIQWRAFFEEHGGDIDIFVTYGRSFAGTQAEQIARIAATGGRKLRVSLLDPEAPEELLSVYADSFEVDVPMLRQRIAEARNIWEQAVQGAAAAGAIELTIERIRTLLPITFYRSGDYIWLVPNVAQHGRVGPRLPCILCRRTGSEYGLFDWIMADVGTCRTQGLIVKEA